MADQALIHDDIKLYTTAENFYLVPTIAPTEVMVIDRVTGTSTVTEFENFKIKIPLNAYKPVCGFLGTIKLISGLYLVVCKYRILVGKVNGQDIFELAGHDLIPFSRSTTHLTSKQIEENATYESMVRAALETPGIYFSYGYDLTHSLQRLHEVHANSTDFNKMSLAMRADPRFLWNRHLLKDFSQEQFSRFCLPLIQGFVSINKVTLGGQGVTWSLISRRAVDRAGTRHIMRGIDAEGHVANFVETEQIIEKDGEKTSFIQTRGSIPLFWSQYPNLKYKPSMQISQENHIAAYNKHMTNQYQLYGNVVLVNLIDQTGKEQSLERGFRSAVATAGLPGVRYEPFDFHAECRGMRYDRLQVLMDRVQLEQTEFEYLAVRGGKILKRQRGVFRTNCVDCLDRTNVVQSMLARRQLADALTFLNITYVGEQFEALFRNVWADHADMISVQYSGTVALKTDFTRTGKRTLLGAIRDGINSLTRYYKNNFCDGFRQDATDLFLGKYTVQDGEGNTALCPLERARDWRYFTFPSILLVATAMFCATAVVPQRYSSDVLIYLMMWGACIGVTFTLIFKHGPLFVDWPRLGAVSTLAIDRTSSL